jgi:glucose/arabinose dehydrogenase
MKKSSITVFSLLLVVALPFFITAYNKMDLPKNNNKPKQDLQDIKTLPGFHVEKLYSPKKHDQGSWVAMTFDNKGRMITSDQYGHLYRVKLPPIGYDSAKTGVKVEKLPIDFAHDTTKAKFKTGFAHGLLYAFNSLYVMVNDEGKPDSVIVHTGIYRLQDTNNDDVYDKITLLKKIDGKGEHGPHSLVLGPKKKAIYTVAGNFTEQPKMDVYRLPKTWKEDNLLTKLYDPRGFGNDLKPPGGWIAKFSPDGSKWTLVAAGFRNPFDFTFNKDGQLFTYDSDMEWDLGLPWYRPTRLCQVIPGADFGYRENDHKWNPAYPDNLPPVINVGQGSPTNVMTAYNARFPAKYRKGIYYFDWSYGIIYHVNLTPDGATYKAKQQEFLSGVPLPLTDGEIGPDGSMYFLTGGRKLESHLYRVYYGNGKHKRKKLRYNEPKSAVKARKTLKQLENDQLKHGSSVIDFAWPYLKNSDRFLRYAARLAIEHQPVDEW